jgi:hypothetical protein
MLYNCQRMYGYNHMVSLVESYYKSIIVILARIY